MSLPAIRADALWKLLAPTLSLEETRIARAVIVLEPNEPVKVEVTILGDRRLLDLDWPLEDAQITSMFVPSDRRVITLDWSHE